MPLFNLKKYVEMKNKYLNKIIAIATLTLFFSCTKKLDELSVNPNTQTLNAITTPQAYNSLIQGIYAYVATPRNLGAEARGILFSRGDETSSGSDYAAFGQNSITPDYYSLKESYQYMYTVAGQAAIAIDAAKHVNFPDTTLRNAYLGEAYCLRAFAHFFLLTNFRQVALIKKALLLPSEYERPINTPMEVWNFIIEDLTKAKQLLPKKGYWKGADVGRLTAGSAAGLLGKAYLYMSGIETFYGGAGQVNKYNEAAKEFGDIINGVYGTYDLVPNYSWNFDVAHENNIESVLEFQFVGSRLASSFNPGTTTSAVDFDYRGIVFPFSNAYISNLRTNSTTVVVHDWLYNAFVASTDNDGNTDPRMFGTLLFNDSSNHPEIKRPTINGTQLRVTGISGLTWNQMYPPSGGKTGMATINAKFAPYQATNRKWIDLTLPSDKDPGSPNLWFGTSYSNGVNYRYIRYADVLLMYAESVLMGGTPTAGSAADAINKVRARSNMPPVDATMDNLKTERILELSLEGHRFMDLLRWGTLDATMKMRESTDPNFKHFGDGSANSTYIPWQDNKNEWLPLSSDDLLTNANIKSNNPGW
jgi:starch-binding outer membrane protein, SusD/RagB family